MQQFRLDRVYITPLFGDLGAGNAYHPPTLIGVGDWCLVSQVEPRRYTTPAGLWLEEGNQ